MFYGKYREENNLEIFGVDTLKMVLVISMTSGNEIYEYLMDSGESTNVQFGGLTRGIY